MDWNWFFSSFCQSAAALLGIIGAFVISRLIGINEKIIQLSDEFEDLKLAFKKNQQSFSVRKFEWYNRTFLYYYGSRIKQEIRGGIYNDTIYAEDRLNLLYNRHKNLYLINSEGFPQFEQLYHEILRTPSSNISFIMIPPGTENELNEEVERINALTINSRELIGKFKNNKRSTESFRRNLKTIRKIVAILLIAFPITVIYPLHFLPMKVKDTFAISVSPFVFIKQLFSLKGFLLAVFFVTITGIFLFFQNMVGELIRTLDKIHLQNKSDYMSLSKYCLFLREEPEE